MYLGGVLMLLGASLLLGSFSSLIGPIALFMALDRHFIPLEEKNLEKAFGKDFLDYKKKKRRWL